MLHDKDGPVAKSTRFVTFDGVGGLDDAGAQLCELQRPLHPLAV
jgi:hypothetical protein